MESIRCRQECCDVVKRVPVGCGGPTWTVLWVTDPEGGGDRGSRRRVVMG